jgi:L-threonylcarbamoyladenylate synthase
MGHRWVPFSFCGKQQAVSVARIYTASDENISFLSEKLLGGELVAVPTETVYGLAANAFDEAACAEIFRAKDRPFFDPLIVHVAADYDLGTIAEVNSLVARLGSFFWPGPLTLVLRKKPVIPDLVTAGLDSVAVRIPRHPVLQRLLHACRVPLAAPSANPFSYVSPTTARHVEEGLGGRVEHILDGGPCEVGVESTILDIRNPVKPAVLRPGGIPREAISRVLGVEVGVSAASGGEMMPGQLKKHYSPRCSSQLHDGLGDAQPLAHPEEAYLFYQRPTSPEVAAAANVFWLTQSGEDSEAARRLFQVLREIDARDFVRLHAELAPPRGLGQAINDRLRRAAALDGE